MKEWEFFAQAFSNSFISKFANFAYALTNGNL